MLPKLSFLIVLVATFVLVACSGSGTSTQVVLEEGNSVINVCVDDGGGVRAVNPGDACEEKETLVLLMTPPSIHVSDEIEEFHIPGGIHAPEGGFKAGNTTTYRNGRIDLSRNSNLDIRPEGDPTNGILFIKGASDDERRRVGIGTKSPSAKLTVNGNFAMGDDTTASGTDSTAMGSRTVASGNLSVAMGWRTTASGSMSTAIGWETTASGLQSIAMGRDTEATGDRSTAMGDDTEASGWNSTAMGWMTTASGDQSTAMGNGTTASGWNSTAMGWRTTATGDQSTAMGNGTTASGHASTVMGKGTTASGLRSTAMGNGTIASGRDSIAMGTLASTDGFAGSFVYGDTSTSNSPSDPSSLVNPTGQNQFVVRASGGTTFYSSSNTTTGNGVTLPPGGGAWDMVSDRDQKHLFRTEEGEAVLEKIAQMPIPSWSYKSQDSSIRHLGPMGQDFYAAFGLGGSELTITTSDISGINILAIQALEERTAELESQRAQIAELEQRNKDLEARLAAVEEKLGLTDASSDQLSFGVPLIWMIGAALGLIMGGPGLVLGYRRFR